MYFESNANPSRILSAVFALAIVSLISASPSQAQPTTTEVAKLTAGDAAPDDEFGMGVAVDGDTAVVGAVGDDISRGSAYVFTQSGGVWTQQAKLTESSASRDVGDLFGWSVALDGDTAVVGAVADDASGSAYVFTRSGSVWTQQAKLTASDAAAFDHFGYSVALDGDTAVVGAYGDDDLRGAAYVFTRSGGVWTQQVKLIESGASRDVLDTFGWSVAVAGDTAAIGTEGDDAFAGSAYVFTRSGGVWTQQAKLTESGAGREAGDRFGWSVALDGDTVTISARLDNGSIGSAYVFTRSGGVWTQQARLAASDGVAHDDFGYSVALAGDRAVVGAPADDGQRGSAYLFTRNGVMWEQGTKLVASDAAAVDAFGSSVALDGDTALIGAPFDDEAIAATSGSGSAYVFVLDVASLLEQLRESATGVGPGKSLANKVALAQAYYAVPDVQSTCVMLKAFTKEVTAQAGKKKLTDAQATELLTSAVNIMAEIGCDGS